MQFKSPLLISLNTNLDPYKDIRIRGAVNIWDDVYLDEDTDIGPNWLTFCVFFIDLDYFQWWIEPNELGNWFDEFDRKLTLEVSQAFLSVKKALAIDGYGNYLTHEFIYPGFEKDPADLGARISPSKAKSLDSFQLITEAIQEKNWNRYTWYDWVDQKYQKNSLEFENQINSNQIVLNLKSKYNSNFEVFANFYKNALGKEAIKLTTNLLIGTRPLETEDPKYFRSLEEIQIRSVLASLFRHSELLHTWIGNTWPEPEGTGFYFLSEDEQNAWVSRWLEFKNIPGRNSAFKLSSGHEEFLNFMESGEIPVIDAPRPYFSIKTNKSSNTKSLLSGYKDTNHDVYPQIIQFGYVLPVDSHEKLVEQLSGSLHVIKTATDIVEDGFRNHRNMPTLDSDIRFLGRGKFHHRSDGQALFDSIFRSESSVKGIHSAEVTSYSRWIPQSLVEMGAEATRQNLEQGLKAKKKWKRKRLFEWVVTDGVDPESVVVAINHLVEEFLIPTKELKKAIELLQVAIGMNVGYESDRASSLQELITK